MFLRAPVYRNWVLDFFFISKLATIQRFAQFNYASSRPFLFAYDGSFSMSRAASCTSDKKMERPLFGWSEGEKQKWLSVAGAVLRHKLAISPSQFLTIAQGIRRILVSSIRINNLGTIQDHYITQQSGIHHSIQDLLHSSHIPQYLG